MKMGISESRNGDAATGEITDIIDIIQTNEEQMKE